LFDKKFEISGIPVIAGENTNAIVLKVARLAAPEWEFDESMLSVSHRLPSTRGFTPKIIAKFTRRDLRDEIYKKTKPLFEIYQRSWLGRIESYLR
jgi:hypothetical protein